VKLAIMQPYLFPYLGYFQLINSVDLFVVYDDVQYIERGWINRNNILLEGKSFAFSMPVKKGKRSQYISERFIGNDFQAFEKKFKETIRHAYKNAPHYINVFNIVTEILNLDNLDNIKVSNFISRSLRIICDYLSIETKFIMSSEIEKDETLKGQDRVIEINRLLGSTHYINPIGGMELYCKEVFRKAGIELSLLKMRPVIYKQYDNEFVPNLSIIDVMMFNSREKIKELLGEYDLL